MNAQAAAVRPVPRLLRVLRVVTRTPRMRRITLTGNTLQGFPAGSGGAHIKLLFPDAVDEVPALPAVSAIGPVWPTGAKRPHARTYTVARFDPDALELDVDIVLHGDGGPASRWAAVARVGDWLGLVGPGGPALYWPQADRFVLIGDPSSYALVAAVMAQLPDHAVGDVLMQIPDLAEIQPLPDRPGMVVRWALRERDGGVERLLRLVQLLAWPSSRVSVTLAGESAQVVAIRDFLVAQRGVQRRHMYAVPYWKQAVDEDAYHEERHRIMDAFAEEPA
ncbi:siderophore-interacting protein [Montanilutibacter psychrotolerans]|uniref:Siderophore-interacting protein n=1 Tax=Montanilutibacter psychrotolerans TaxID=1327343 RepID=A0A3M8SSV3_9GAMM|nr:siderophore-interacting protein [Lysobacter psychrotolerans]RNF84397.1 siderophore-interacting protein [Lysobacter psychrotolerans]